MLHEGRCRLRRDRALLRIDHDGDEFSVRLKNHAYEFVEEYSVMAPRQCCPPTLYTVLPRIRSLIGHCVLRAKVRDHEEVIPAVRFSMSSPCSAMCIGIIRMSRLDVRGSWSHNILCTGHSCFLPNQDAIHCRWNLQRHSSLASSSPTSYSTMQIEHS